MSVNTASYADLLVMITALKEENERLRDRVAELVAIGKEMASDLEDAICARYGVNVARLHPALVNNFKRDLDVVHRFRQRFDMEEPADEG